MKDFSKKRPGRRLLGRGRFVTKSGAVVKIHRTLSSRLHARKDARARQKATYLSTLPKDKVLRLLARLHPKRVARYWFSRRGAIMALKLLGIGAVSVFLLLVGLFAYFRKDLPNLRDPSGSTIGGSIRYYDRSGQTLLWEDYDAVRRIPLAKDEEISQFVKDATVAIEDKDFFKHSGFDVRAIIRAGWNNVRGRSGTQGGSTITQQLVKLTLNWSKDRTYTRKIKELILAVELERSYTKPEILRGYLNTAPYGSINYGVEVASRSYFNKSAKDLTLEEAAMLAAIPKSPSVYSPYSESLDREALVGRMHYILDLMEQQGMINKEQRDAAKAIDVLAKVSPRTPTKYEGIRAPWFVLAAKEQLEDIFANKTSEVGGWRVTTTLDLNLQTIAEEEISKGMAQVRRQGGDTAAFVAEDVKTGQVAALVGGSDFRNEVFGQNNYARLRLPPGSSFKPYDFVALMEHHDNFGAGSVLYDSMGPLEGYPCTRKVPQKQGGDCLFDYDFKFPGPVTLRYGLGGSRNVPAVKAMLITGVNKTIETAEKLMGNPGSETIASGYNCYDPSDASLTKESPCYASSAIGDGAYLRLDEHVHGFATISRNGLNIPRTYLLKVEDAKGETLDEWKPDKGEQVVRADSAYIVADILSDPKASYFSQKVHEHKGHKYSLKTGTTNDAKDGLLMGASTQYAAGVWVGYHNRERVMSGFMETMTRPIWVGWMNRVHSNLKPEDRQRPPSVQSLPAFVVRNHVGTGSIEPSPTNDLYPSWYKQAKKTATKQTIDIVSNKLATECTPGRAKKTLDNADASVFSGDPFHGGGNANTQEKDDIHKCEDLKPGISLTVSDLGSGQYQFTAYVTQGTHSLHSDKFPGTVNFLIDGQVLPGGTFTMSQPGSVSMIYTSDATATRNVTAEIIDSVLYDASTTQQVDFQPAGGGDGDGAGAGARRRRGGSDDDDDNDGGGAGGEGDDGGPILPL